MNQPPFHLAIPVGDLTSARAFYGGLLGCSEGRSSTSWIDFNFYGHQLVCHLDNSRVGRPPLHNPVDGHAVPVPHFGVVLEMDAWHALVERLTQQNTPFIIEPYVRFAGQPGEQATLFIQDPSGNALEFKAFKNIQEELFKTE